MGSIFLMSSLPSAVMTASSIWTVSTVAKITSTVPTEDAPGILWVEWYLHSNFTGLSCTIGTGKLSA
ncbi:hypothetical protein D9M69_631900 [compost metagenome]